ncbi:hypothetical protein, partial [Klebsiella pneumoniae]|uniref:hypothetical protein n=1 Tax=Klebsiella pneumoniae TaxID=573 RepID=UPI00197AD6BF
AATAALAQTLLENEYEVAMIQDPYLIEGRLHGFPGLWKTFHSKNKQAWLVLAKAGLKYSAPTSLHSTNNT